MQGRVPEVSGGTDVCSCLDQSNNVTQVFTNTGDVNRAITINCDLIHILNRTA